MYSRSKLSLSRDCSNLFWRRLRSSPSVLEQMSVPAEKFAKKERRKEIIVNTKYDKCSDPMYRHLLFSTEIDVFLTAKRGKVWMERVCARNMAAKREKHDREMSALSSPVPVALQYLYGGSNVVQGEEYLAKQRSEEEASALRDLHIPEIIDRKSVV